MIRFVVNPLSTYLYCACTVVPCVCRVWQRMVDEHALLLNDLDFSDPSLSSRITSGRICDVIARSGKRLSTFAIWNQFDFYPAGGSLAKANWSLKLIVDAIITATRSVAMPSETSLLAKPLKLFRLYGHQYVADVCTASLLRLSPRTIELVTCSEGSLIDIADELTAITDGAIQLTSRVAKYGTFICSTMNCPLMHHRDNGNNRSYNNNNGNTCSIVGWYRQCPRCSRLYCCQSCVAQWNTCQCSHVVLNKQLQLMCVVHCSACPCT
jgi:hypothetical protein